MYGCHDRSLTSVSREDRPRRICLACTRSLGIGRDYKGVGEPVRGVVDAGPASDLRVAAESRWAVVDEIVLERPGDEEVTDLTPVDRVSPHLLSTF